MSMDDNENMVSFYCFLKDDYGIIGWYTLIQNGCRRTILISCHSVSFYEYIKA